MPTNSATIRRFEEVRERVAEAAVRGGTDPGRVILVAVTKNASISQVRELIEHGHMDFGESRMQHFIQFEAQVADFLDRHQELGGRGGTMPESVRWHFIGHLQRNKVRKILPATTLIHSVDSLRLAEEIQACPGRREGTKTQVLIQVNTAGEKGKFGIAPPATSHLIDQIADLPDIRVRGLMCMAPKLDDPGTLKAIFDRTREIFEEIKKSGAAGDQFNILSMGMSGDYEQALECGANVVRVGTAIFGEPTGDSGEPVPAGDLLSE